MKMWKWENIDREGSIIENPILCCTVRGWLLWKYLPTGILQLFRGLHGIFFLLAWHEMDCLVLNDFRYVSNIFSNCVLLFFQLLLNISDTMNVTSPDNNTTRCGGPIVTGFIMKQGKRWLMATSRTSAFWCHDQSSPVFLMRNGSILWTCFALNGARYQVQELLCASHNSTHPCAIVCDPLQYTYVYDFS